MKQDSAFDIDLQLDQLGKEIAAAVQTSPSPPPKPVHHAHATQPAQAATSLSASDVTAATHEALDDRRRKIEKVLFRTQANIETITKQISDLVGKRQHLRSEQSEYQNTLDALDLSIGALANDS